MTIFIAYCVLEITINYFDETEIQAKVMSAQQATLKISSNFVSKSNIRNPKSNILQLSNLILKHYSLLILSNKSDIKMSCL